MRRSEWLSYTGVIESAGVPFFFFVIATAPERHLFRYLSVDMSRLLKVPFVALISPVGAMGVWGVRGLF